MIETVNHQSPTNLGSSGCLYADVELLIEDGTPAITFSSDNLSKARVAGPSQARDAGPSKARDAGLSKARDAGPSKAPEAGPSKALKDRSGCSASQKEGGSSEAITFSGKASRRKRKRGDSEVEWAVGQYLIAGELKNLRKMCRCKRRRMEPMEVVEEYGNGVATHMVQQIYT